MKKLLQFFSARSYLFLICFVIAAIGNGTFAQTTTITGTVTDASTGEPLIAAAVNFVGTTIGTNTELDGTYTLSSTNATATLEFSYLGYETTTRLIQLNTSQVIDVQLQLSGVVLQEAVVTAESDRYRNKDNPAVALIKKVIEQKSSNNASNLDSYAYEKYEKIMLGLSNVTDKFKQRKSFKKVQFLFENLDTTAIAGQEVLPIYIKESLSDVVYTKTPREIKELLIADTMVTFDGYADDEGFNLYLNNLYQNIDIFDDNVLLLNQQFLSPIADAAPTFYKYFIQDTLTVDGVECIELFFAPRNKLDILFQGSIFIAYLDNYNIKRLDMAVNANTSLNWVKTINIKQDFVKQAGTRYIQVSDEFAADFGLTKKGMGMYGNRSVSNTDIVLNQPIDEVKAVAKIENMATLASQNSDAFWATKRHTELSASELLTYRKIDSLKSMKIFKQTMSVLTLVLSGYTKITPYFELGPVNTFYSFNPIEGFRMRVGGRTTQAFSEKLEFETYGAYGFRDEQWKGYLGISHALPNGNLQKFPIRRIRGSAQRETKIPGQELQFVQEDNILLSFKRGINDRYLYNDIYRLEYLSEFENDLRFSIELKNWTQSPAGSLVFKQVGNPDFVTESITVSEVNTTLRWAPNENFYQGKTYRSPIYNEYPVFTLRYSAGIKGVLGGEYTYHNVSLNAFKRFYLSRFGYSDVYLEGGKVFGDAVPYPLLSIHAGNQTYSFQLQGYNLMNFLEFVSDQYVSLNIDHNLNGLVLNRIPLVRQLKLREVFNVRLLYGSISDGNNPSLNSDLIAFPTDVNGNSSTFSLEQKPYVEGSIGVSNVFRFFRIDLVRRFNYLKNPNVTKMGLRARFKIYF